MYTDWFEAELDGHEREIKTNLDLTAEKYWK